jgi:hypothetical protein
MSNSNPLPARPFAICFHCDAVEGLTKASEDGWTVYFRQHRRFGYLCPSCQSPAQPVEDAVQVGGAEFIPQQGDRIREARPA